MNRLVALLLFVFALAAGAPAVGWAKTHGQRATDGRQELPRAVTRAGMSLDDAVQMVQQRFNARVVRAETRSDDGRTVYHLRLMNSDGKVWTVRVDAQRGSVQ